MATNPTSKKGQCINYGNCSKASSKEIIEVNLGDDFNCPECNGSLIEIKKKPFPMWIIVVIALVVIGGVVGALFGTGVIGGEKKEEVVITPPTPAPAPEIEEPQVEIEVPIYIETIGLDQAQVSLNVNQTVQLEWEISPEDALIDQLEWVSSNEEVASVDKGLVTGLKEGRSLIELRDNQGNKASARCEVTVVKEKVATSNPKTLSFSYGKYTGDIKNGKANGFGKLVFTKSYQISEYDKTQKRMAEPGDYVEGQFENNNFYSGKWFDKNGSQKGAIILQKLGL